MNPPPTIPFDFSLFYAAMCYELGREPDTKWYRGWDGYYHFRYQPRDEAEAKKFAESASVLQGWLKHFDLTPVDTQCFFGYLPCPQAGEEGLKYLDIHIAHPVPKREIKPDGR